jgi:hypothetical protein
LTDLLPPTLSNPGLEKAVEECGTQIKEIALELKRLSNEVTNPAFKKAVKGTSSQIKRIALELTRLSDVVTNPAVEKAVKDFSAHIDTIALEMKRFSGVVSDPALQTGLIDLKARLSSMESELKGAACWIQSTFGWKAGLALLLPLLVIAPPLWLLAFREAPSSPATILMCQTAAKHAQLKTKVFESPTFVSGESEISAGWNFAELQSELGKSNTKQAVFWTVQAGHDIDELKGKKIEKYGSNFGLATQRVTWLRKELEHKIESTGLHAPIFVSVLGNANTDKANPADKTYDRTARVILSYYEPPLQEPSSPAVQCTPVSDELLKSLFPQL